MRPADIMRLMCGTVASNTVLGPELLTNGDFSSNGSGWTAVNGTMSFTGNVLKLSITNNPARTYRTVATVIGRTYQVTYDANDGTATAGVFVATTNNNFSTPSGYGPAAIGGTFRFTAPASTMFFICRASGLSGYATFDNLSVKEVISG